MADHDSITADELRSILHYNPLTGVFTRRKSAGGRLAGSVAGSLNSHGYMQVGVLKRLYMAHRLAWLYVYGTWPKNQIDHINRSRADNRIANLRDVTSQQNLCNAGTYNTNTSGRKGVYWVKRDSRWRACIVNKGRYLSLGYFGTQAEAVSARVAAEKLYWAELAL